MTLLLRIPAPWPKAAAFGRFVILTIAAAFSSGNAFHPFDIAANLTFDPRISIISDTSSLDLAFAYHPLVHEFGRSDDDTFNSFIDIMYARTGGTVYLNTIPVGLRCEVMNHFGAYRKDNQEYSFDVKGKAAMLTAATRFPIEHLSVECSLGRLFLPAYDRDTMYHRVVNNPREYILTGR
ncbi:MAG: hypothetical protein GF401_17705 [Chitinivibrionales bacterium]|nr:hypothetical protein [Chitinivibrionales bacterium]